MLTNPGRLVLKNNYSFCVGEYAKYGFDQQRLIWYVFGLKDIVFSSDVSSVGPSSEQTKSSLEFVPKFTYKFLARR